jgi:DNA repair exonuclease SbcCD nuclease subunit
MLKIMAIGDSHIQPENILEVNILIQRLEELAKKIQPDFIVILGDTLHTHERVHTTALNKAYEFIDRMRKLAHTFVLNGNHDSTSNQIFLTDHHWMNGMKEWENVTIVDKVIVKEEKGYKFTFVPYVAPGKFIKALDTVGNAWKNSHCIFAHQEFQGCKMGAITSIEGDEWKEEYPYTVSGHIHSRQFIGKNIYYCGSSMQHAFGESEKNIIPILSWKNSKQKKYDLEEVDLCLPRKKIVYSDVDSMEDYKIPENTQDKIKITLSGNYEEFKAFKRTKKYKELIKSGTKVVFKPKKLKAPEGDEDKKDPDYILNTESTENDFSKILNALVLREKNKYLYQVYELVINNKEISEEDFLIL